MANHRARAQFDRAKWRLSLVLPLWALQLTLAMIMTALFSWRLGDSVKKHRQGETAAVEFAWQGTNMALSLVAACCTFFEMGKLMAESLTPCTMLLTHLVKLACALAMLALDVAVYALRAEARYSLIGLGLDAMLIITAVVLSVYAIVTYRRLSAYDDYARPVNFKGYGFNDDDDDDFSRSSIRSAAPEPCPPESSYSHRRDTQFDDYVARRSSLAPGRGPAEEAASSSSAASAKTRSRGPSYTGEPGLVAVPEEDPDSLGGPEKRERLLQG